MTEPGRLLVNHRRRRRWLIPTVIAGAVVMVTCIAGAIGSLLAAGGGGDAGPEQPATEYQSIQELRAAVEDAGVECTSWKVVDSPRGALERASCTDTITLAIHSDAEQVDQSVQTLAELVTELDRNSVHLTGDNWAVNCGQDETLCQRLRDTLGGSVRVISPEEVSAQEPTKQPDPPSAAPPQVFEGSGDDVLILDEPLTGILVAVFECSGCSSNVVLESDGPERLLVNEIGSYSGKKWINLEDGASTGQFVVTANAGWTLTVGPVTELATHASDGTASGSGDDVLLLEGDYRALSMTHDGESNFVVEGYNLDDGRGGLLVNEIGRYDGAVPLDGPALVQVSADGAWTIAPRG